MDMRQLATFRMVARTLSFTRAATALNYVQSTVTAQIQALEHELNVPLFDRLGKRIALTDAGQRLLEYADRILALADEAQMAVAHADHPAGKLTISAPESLCIYRLPAVLRQFRAQYPAVRLLFRPAPSLELRRMVSEGELDMAYLLDEPIRSTELVVNTLMEENILLVVPPDHPLATAADVTPADIQGEPVVLTETGCAYRLLFERALAAAGIHLTEMLEFRNVEAIKQCVLAGMGVGVLPAFVVERDVAEGRLAVLPWRGDTLNVFTQVVYHKDKWLSPALRAFLDITADLFATPAPALLDLAARPAMVR
ncbi:MAG: LysR family transcriptional regulator [Chloroflexaceae bacterium]|nr:LysR family transcriptional regulator [Chloroflexaceae bacterium]NJO07388.1 LysR family transcriptional regulator [Chloroflexaceae bacterium]